MHSVKVPDYRTQAQAAREILHCSSAASLLAAAANAGGATALVFAAHTSGEKHKALLQLHFAKWAVSLAQICERCGHVTTKQHLAFCRHCQRKVCCFVPCDKSHLTASHPSDLDPYEHAEMHCAAIYEPFGDERHGFGRPWITCGACTHLPGAPAGWVRRTSGPQAPPKDWRTAQNGTLGLGKTIRPSRTPWILPQQSHYIRSIYRHNLTAWGALFPTAAHAPDTELNETFGLDGIGLLRANPQSGRGQGTAISPLMARKLAASPDMDWYSNEHRYFIAPLLMAGVEEFFAASFCQAQSHAHTKGRDAIPDDQE
jgi:hypothetical protein